MLPKIKLKTKLFIIFFAVSAIPLIVSSTLLTTGWGLTQMSPQMFAIVLTAFFLVAVILLGLWLASQITKPIKELLIGSGYLNGGNLSYRLQIKSGDEFGQLAENFNNLAQKTQEASQKLAADKDLISSERNKLAVTLSSIIDAVIAVDLSRNIIIFNKVAENLTGFSSQEVIGKPLESIIKIFDNMSELQPQEYCPIKQGDFEGVIFSKQNLKLISLKNQPQDLQPFHIEDIGKQHEKKNETYINLVVSRIKEGLAVNLGAILTLHNVTEENQLEEMKLDFVSMAAHELRTPLTSIKGYLSVYTQENAKTLNREQSMFLNRINISAQQLSALVDNLLSVSRIERGMLTITTQPVEWGVLVKDVVNGFSNSAEEKKIQLSFIEPNKPVPKIPADRVRITEVLSNLLANAIAYTAPGGSIKVWLEPTETEVITHIGDTGQGIPSEAIPHLFTKFFRVSGKLEQGSKGTGLGLYISRAIIELHKGKIWVNSELGKGSVFSFSLPAQ